MSVIASMVAVLKAEVGPFAKGMKTAQGALDSFATGARKTGLAAAAMGGAISASVGFAASRFSEFGDAVAKMAARTGLSTEAVSALRFAADQSATSIEAIEKSIKRLSVNITTGSKVLERYGLNLEELKRSTPEQQFFIVAEAISKIEDPTRRLAAAQELLGKSGAELIPLFADGAAGLEAFKEQAEQLGLIMGGPAAKNAEILNDKMGQLKLQVDAMWVAIGQQLAPALIQLITKVQEFIPPLLDWVEANSDLVVGLGLAGAGLVALGGAMLTASVAAKGLSAAIWGVNAALNGLKLAYAIGAGLVALGQAAFILARGFGIAEAATIALRAALVLLQSSTVIGAVVTIIASATAAFLAFTDAGNAMVSWVYNKAAAAFQYLGDRIHWLLSLVGLANEEMNALANAPLPQQPVPQQPAAKPGAVPGQPAAAGLGQIIKDFGAQARQQLFAGNVAKKFGDAIAERVKGREELEKKRQQVIEQLAIPQQPLPKPVEIAKAAGANVALEAGSAEFNRILNAGKKQQTEDQIRKKHFEEAREATKILGKMLDAMTAEDNAGVAFG